MARMISLTLLLQKQLFRLFRIALVLFAGLQACAHASSYEIEVIVFERPDSGDLELEYWNFSRQHLSHQQTSLEEMGQSRHLLELSRNPAYGLTQNLQRLDDFVPRLNSNNLPVLATARWIQPAFFFQNAPVISLGVEGSRLASAYFRVYKTSLLFADMALQLSPTKPVVKPAFSLSEESAENALDASALEFDHEYLIDSWPEVESLDPEYFLIERRRIRFKEVHYFDHPAFGVLLGIWSTN
ncbi:MAG: CsiV family protein [Gammaproteobacteria bacterium]|nr:CsiV family protein [Gammaproteobacteria bacterium]